MDQAPNDETLLPFSKRTVTRSRIYYDIVYARSLEEAVAQFGTSAMQKPQQRPQRARHPRRHRTFRALAGRDHERGDIPRGQPAQITVASPAAIRQERADQFDVVADGALSQATFTR